MFNSKPIKNFEISIENIIERFGNSEEPYSVYIDICNDALRVNMGNYSVISSIAITTALLAEKIKPEKVFVNQQLFFKSNLLNTVNSCVEWGSKDIMIQYLCERGCSKCKTFDRKCFPVANFLDKEKELFSTTFLPGPFSRWGNHRDSRGSTPSRFVY